MSPQAPPNSVHPKTRAEWRKRDGEAEFRSVPALGEAGDSGMDFECEEAGDAGEAGGGDGAAGGGEYSGQSVAGVSGWGGRNAHTAFASGLLFRSRIKGDKSSRSTSSNY